MKKLVVWVSLFLTLTACGSVLNVATFNIEYFGLGGSSAGEFKDEYRIPFLKEFMDKELSEVDVFIFEEIVNKESLYKMMAERNFSCVSYERAAFNHQYVVLCHSNRFVFKSLNQDGEGYQLEDVLAGNQNMRSGVWGLLQDSEGKISLRIIGVHLKAHPDGRPLRFKQVQALAKRLGDEKDKFPTIVIGDFNAHGNDALDFEKIFSESPFSLSLARYGEEFSYRTLQFSGAYDQAYVSSHITYSAFVKGPCNNKDNFGKRFDQIDFYNRTISDHCPVVYNLNF